MPSTSAALIDGLHQVLGPAKEPIGLHEPSFQGKEWAYVKDCLDSGWVSSIGSYVDLFEEKIAEICGVNHAISVVNGTNALHVALLVAGVAADDEVLMPTMTFVASANAVSYCGAVPHFADCERQSLGIDAEKLAGYLNEIAEKKDGGLYNKNTGRRIAALMPVHVFGHPADMEGLQELGLPVVSDAAEALGSLYKDKPAASFGLLSTLSFNGNKIVTTGGGGAILTNDSALAKSVKHLCTTAKQPHAWEFMHDAVGYNFRLPNINAALGCAQLEKLDADLAKKRKLAGAYEAEFQKHSNIEFFKEPPHAKSNYWLNAVIVDGDRDQILQKLHDAGYHCRPVWRLMHQLDMYKDCPRMDVSTAEELARKIINLPSSAKWGERL